jgi:hypothetical protein
MKNYDLIASIIEEAETDGLSIKNMIDQWKESGKPREIDGLIKFLKDLGFTGDNIVDMFEKADIELSDRILKRNNLPITDRKETFLGKLVRKGKDLARTLNFNLDNQEEFDEFAKVRGKDNTLKVISAIKSSINTEESQ